MSEFGHREQHGPFFQFIRGEQSQVSFQFLIYSFSLSISLWMIGGRESDVVLEKASEFPGECRGELWSSVRDYLGVGAELRENMSEKSWTTPAVPMFFVQGQ